MSAFMLTKHHIDALLTFATTFYNGSITSYWNGTERVRIDYETVDEIGAKLMAQNQRSVNYRYRKGEDAPDYTYQHYQWPLTPVEALVACASYDYQSCETPDYLETEAHAIIDAIRYAAIHQLPGYDEAGTWNIDNHPPHRLPAAKRSARDSERNAYYLMMAD